MSASSESIGQARAHGRLRSILTGLGLALFSTLVALTCCEVVWRTFVTRQTGWPHWTPTPFVPDPDPELGFTLHPNHESALNRPGQYFVPIHTNSMGLRGGAIRPEPPGEITVLVIGDSFAFGWGVEETEAVSARMEAHLREAGIPARVVNGGVPCYDLRQTRIFASRILPVVKPRIVIATFFPGNDLLDYEEPQKWYADPDSGQLHLRESSAGMLPRSYLLEAAWRAMGDMIRFALRRPARNNYHYLTRTATRTMTDRWESSFKVLRDIETEVRAAGAGFAVALVPMREQIQPDFFEARLRGLRLAPSSYDAEAPSLAAEELARKDHIELIDLLPTLREADRSAPQYFSVDGHWSAAGNDTVARALAGWVSEHRETTSTSASR